MQVRSTAASFSAALYFSIVNSGASLPLFCRNARCTITRGVNKTRSLEQRRVMKRLFANKIDYARVQLPSNAARGIAVQTRGIFARPSVIFIVQLNISREQTEKLRRVHDSCAENASLHSVFAYRLVCNILRSRNNNRCVAAAGRRGNKCRF